jgi:hypothetical protein
MFNFIYTLTVYLEVAHICPFKSFEAADILSRYFFSLTSVLKKLEIFTCLLPRRRNRLQDTFPKNLFIEILNIDILSKDEILSIL